MIIRDVDFVKSAVKPAQYPEYDFSEIAFAGRSMLENLQVLKR